MCLTTSIEEDLDDTVATDWYNIDDLIIQLLRCLNFKSLHPQP